MCFLDITGYDRLTNERGDAEAAHLAERLSRMVRRTATEHGGRPVKRLGDGVMLFFPDPGRGVVAALEMVEGVVAAGLPPAHVGLHAGPVLLPSRCPSGRSGPSSSRALSSRSGCTWHLARADPASVRVVSRRSLTIAAWQQPCCRSDNNGRWTHPKDSPIDRSGVPMLCRRQHSSGD